MKKKAIKHLLLLVCCSFLHQHLLAQTDNDAIMMAKKQFCIGPMYGGSSWDHYWEGINKRDNANIGTVSSSMISVMGNYGISSKLNFLFGLPYVTTKVSAGNQHGMKGLQDLSLWLKYMPVEKDFSGGVFSVYTMIGASLPVDNYVADDLPFSIGLHSKTLSLRGMLDFQHKSFFSTLSGTYTFRSNVQIDRTAYYTTEMHYSNMVAMPDQTMFTLRTGWRSDRFIAEAILNHLTTLGGFDITKNNMPFLSNRMNMTTIGVNGKYNIAKVNGLSLTGGADYTIAGRNVGQATNYNLGIFYIVQFSKNHTVHTKKLKK